MYSDHNTFTLFLKGCGKVSSKSAGKKTRGRQWTLLPRSYKCCLWEIVTSFCLEGDDNLRGFLPGGMDKIVTFNFLARKCIF